MGTAYKYFGLPSDRDNPANLPANGEYGTGLHGEYNSLSPTFQPRINDVYIFCPPFGEDTTDAVIWTPSIRRDDPPADGVSKISYSEFSVEEFVGATSYAWPYSNNVNSLQANGITLYIKLKNEATADYPEVREERGPYQEIRRIAGVCAHTGTIVQTGIGNTFGWTLGHAMCLGLRMDKKHSAANTSRLFYYIVNRNTDNNREIIWRIQFAVGINSRGTFSAGTTLPFGTYLLSNPYIADPVNGITLVHPNYPGGTYFITIGNTADEAFSRSSDWSGGRGKLAIEYNTVFAITSTNKPSGQTWGTDDPNIQYPNLDPDFRPYTINSVPLI
jgi:hypothetical protein